MTLLYFSFCSTAIRLICLVSVFDTVGTHNVLKIEKYCISITNMMSEIKISVKLKLPNFEVCIYISFTGDGHQKNLKILHFLTHCCTPLWQLFLMLKKVFPDIPLWLITFFEIFGWQQSCGFWKKVQRSVIVVGDAKKNFIYMIAKLFKNFFLPWLRARSSNWTLF